jgi:hypothetical protein
MNLRLLLTIPIIALTGCGTTHSGRGNYSAANGNQADFNRYVEQRSATLLSMGAFKNASEAQAKAYSEAANIYGPRPGDSATFTIWGKRRSEPVDTAKLDELARDR